MIKLIIKLYRAGDFYEAYGEDAKHMAEALFLTLTQRGGRAMAGIPYHNLERDTKALCEAGYMVEVISKQAEAD